MKLNKFILGVSSLALVACNSNKKHDNDYSSMENHSNGMSDENGYNFKSLSDSENIQDRVFFKFDSYKIPSNCEKSRQILNAQAEYLSQEIKSGNVKKILIEGHCDAIGTPEYNLALGHKRAHSLKHELVKRGINANHIETVSFGSSKPESLGDEKEDHKQNRRAVINIG